MLAGAIRRWWAQMGPYYTKTYRDVYIGVGIMAVIYYRISYGGKKEAAVTNKPSH
ncbi:ATP synthase subunit ATP5MPL, mitochondrial [Gambusia affinis]|uniref:ATP synthase subunit ATP5MPL, mitochondrial n=1 Tax=Gambusia affinis TaxID=33528 RepID=UPI001CDD1D22|nr:ATP synthase subunit ATP5MPL, mitochondrial [Gambusia affinis]